MANDRIWYAVQQVGLKGASPVHSTGDYTAVHGLQSASFATNFNNRQVFEFSNLSIYDTIEGLPDITITLNKALDGYPLIYSLGSVDASTTSLMDSAKAQSIVGLAIFSDTLDSATGTPLQIAESSGVYISSVNYSFPIDGNFTEEVTFVGNDRLWKSDSRVVNSSATGRQATMNFAGVFDNTDSPIGSGGVNQRENMIFDGTGSNNTLLPNEIPGIAADGTNTLTGAGHTIVSNISVRADLNRTDIDELGRKGPYLRTLTPPVEITCEIAVTSRSGDMISATEDGILTTGAGSCSDLGNLSDQTIQLATCEGTRISLGDKNRLSSLNYGGGDTGGGNVTVTYTYTTYNDLTITHT